MGEWISGGGHGGGMVRVVVLWGNSSCWEKSRGSGESRGSGGKLGPFRGLWFGVSC